MFSVLWSKIRSYLSCTCQLLLWYCPFPSQVKPQLQKITIPPMISCTTWAKNFPGQNLWNTDWRQVSPLATLTLCELIKYSFIHSELCEAISLPPPMCINSWAIHIVFGLFWIWLPVKITGITWTASSTSPEHCLNTG